jgi:hypothetical protein
MVGRRQPLAGLWQKTAALMDTTQPLRRRLIGDGSGIVILRLLSIPVARIVKDEK